MPVVEASAPAARSLERPSAVAGLTGERKLMRRAVVLVALVVSLVLLAGQAGAGGSDRLSSAQATGKHSPCVVPNLKGKTVGAARRAIKSHHCSLGAIRRAFSRTVASGRVISQRPHPGARRPTSSRVGLVVSQG